MNYISKLELDGSTAPIGSSLFGICETAADTARKIVDIPEFDEAIDGTTIYVKFIYGNIHSTPSLKVGDDNNRNVIRRGSQAIPENAIVSFTCVNGYWEKTESQIYPTVVIANTSETNLKGYCCGYVGENYNQYLIVSLRYTVTNQNPLTLSINGKTPSPIYINGQLSGGEINTLLEAGMYIVLFDGTNYHFRLDGIIPGTDNYFVKKTGDTINGSLIATNWITAGTDTKESGTLLRALNKNGYAALYAETIGENPDDDHYKIGLMSSVRNHETYDTQPILYRMTNYGKSATYLAGYDKNGNYRPYTLGAGAPQTGWFSSIPVIDSNGVMEIGRYVDFHNSDTDTSNYTFRINNTQDGKLSLSGTVNQGSSRKIKENIEDISLDEAKNILNLRPVRFDYITGSKDERGFIAEEVAEIYPNLVAPENEEFQIPASLNYIGIIPYLVKVIQDQEKRLNEQEKQIKELEK